MALNIEDTDTHAMAKKLAGLTGESLTKAVKRAIEDRLVRLKKTQSSATLVAELDRIALHCAKLPRRDKRDANEIVGYNEKGLHG